MNVSRIATKALVATVGGAIGTLCVVSAASAVNVAPPGGDSGQLIAPPAPVAATSGTSLWWFVLVAAISVLATVVVMAAVRASRRVAGPVTIDLTDHAPATGRQDASRSMS
jgi:hypothetical protein